MSAVVLDAEMTVADEPSGNLRRDTIEFVVLVTELVPDENRDSAREPGAQREREICPPWERLRADEPGAHEELHIEEHEPDIEQHAVVRVGRHQRHDGFRRSVSVFAENHIRYRNDHEDIEERKPEDGGVPVEP